MLISILCSFSLYFSFKIININSENLTIRKLQDDPDIPETESDESAETESNKDMEEICKNGPEELHKFYYEGGQYDTSSLESSRSDPVDALINIIQGDDLLTNAKTYGMSALKWLIFIVCGVLSILGWIICNCCNCCGCCCCCCCKNRLCNIITFLLSAGSFVTVFILSMHSFVAVKNAITGMNGASCSLLQFIHEIIDGQSDKSQSSYWIGIEGINSVLNEVSTGIQNSIDKRSDKFFIEKNEYDKYIKGSEEAIKNANNAKADKGTDNKLLSIQINSSLSLIPDAVMFWGTTTTDNKYLKLVNDEYNELKNSSSQLIEDMNTNFIDITNCSYVNEQKTCGDSKVKKIIDDSQKSVEDMKAPIEDLKTKITDPLIDYQNIINDYGNKYGRLVFLVLCGFCAAITALLLFFKIFNCIGKLFKCFINILWNILAVFTIICFLLGGAIGLIGKIGKDLVDVMAIVTSNENLASSDPILLDKVGDDVSKYLTECLSGDGDLAEVLNLKSQAQGIEDLNNLRDQFITLQESVSQFQESKIPNFYQEDYIEKYYERNFYETESMQDIFNLKEHIDKINEYTTKDGEKQKEFQTAAACAPIDEIWDYKEVDGYSEPTDYSIGAQNGISALINLYKVNDTVYNNRYPSSFCGGEEAQSIVDQEAPIFFEINKCFIPTTTTILSNLFTHQNSIKHNMDNVYVYVNKVVETALIIISEITDSLNKYMGESGSIWNLLNCKFMGIDLNILLRNLDTGLGDKFLKMGTEISTLAVLQAAGIIFTIISLNIEVDDKKKKTAKNEKGNVPPKKIYINELDKCE
jgi:hypothetical protein